MKALGEEIAAMVAKLDYVSFAQLAQKWPEHFDLKGGIAFGPAASGPGGMGEAIFWPGVSEDGFEAIRDLASSQAIKYEDCEALVYYIDGQVPNLPLAMTVREYKSPRWIPVVLRPGRLAKTGREAS